MSDTTETEEAPALPGDGLREAIVDELRRHIGDALVEHLLKPNDDLWVRVGTDAWADTGGAAGDGLRVLLLPVGHRLDAVAVRPRRGRPDAAAARAHDRGRAGVRRRRDPVPGVRPGHRHPAPRRRHAQGRRPRRHAGRSTRGTRSTPAPTGTSARPTRCSASASPATPTCATCTCRPSSRATRCARTSRCSPAWSSRGRASSTSSRCPRRTPTAMAWPTPHRRRRRRQARPPKARRKRRPRRPPTRRR